MGHCYKHFTCVINNSHKNPMRVGFPGGPVVENLPANAGGTGLIPGQDTKIPHVVWCGQKKKKKLVSCFVSLYSARLGR